MDKKCEYSQIFIPIDPAYGKPVARYVGEVARKMGFDTENSGSIEQGVRQAISDVIDTSFEPGAEGNLIISCERVPEGLRVAIRDKGMPAGTLQIPEEASEPGVDGTSDLESRIFRLKKYADEISLHNLGPEGKETILVKHLKTRTIRDYFEACELEPFAPPSDKRVTAAGKIRYTVRPMKPSEAVEVSKCIYKAYGYSYAYEDAYYPDRIKELNGNGRMFSAVAVTEKNDIAGHCALLSWHDNERIAEIAQAVVKPEYRSQGVLTRLTDYIIRESKTRGLLGVFVQAVTVHTYSQRVALRLGLKECAIILGYFRKTETFKGIAEELSQRVGVVIGFMSLTQPDKLAIYPPPSHETMIRRLYRHLDMNPEIGAPSFQGGIEEPDSTLRTDLIGRMSYARIEVVRYGRDVVKEIRVRLKELCLKGIEVINLYLNLSDPRTSTLTQEFEKLGFFYAGILPGGTRGGDALVLQYLNNVRVDYDRIRVESGIAKELLAYVEAHDPNRV
jgi:GNAT superfamily N-acetyltransferase/anti-sigma regulatory factor (Ser/Thr protein kinase)